MKLLLRLYPAWWRRRYGAEALDILQSHPVTPAALWDLVVGAIDAWLNQEMPPSTAGDYSRDAGHLMTDNNVRMSGSSALSIAPSAVISRGWVVASAAVLGCECIACFFAASVELGQRGAMVGVDPAEAAEQARFVIELYAIGALNLLASSTFLLRRSTWSWWLVLGTQVGLFALALIEGALTDLGWFFFGSLPLLTFLLLVAFRMGQAGLTPAAVSDPTP